MLGRYVSGGDIVIGRVLWGRCVCFGLGIELGWRVSVSAVGVYWAHERCDIVDVIEGKG